MTQQDFSQAIATLMNNEDTRTALLEKLSEIMPENDEIKLAHLYFTNEQFQQDLNQHVWERRIA